MLFRSEENPKQIEFAKLYLTNVVTGKRYIKKLVEDGMTMVVVTHEMGFAREVASRVMFINEGQIQEENTPKEFFSHPENPRLCEFLSKVL